jgi:hypothetical protein
VIFVEALYPSIPITLIVRVGGTIMGSNHGRRITGLDLTRRVTRMEGYKASTKVTVNS